jgi:hypothetical protein
LLMGPYRQYFVCINVKLNIRYGQGERIKHP